MLVSRNTDMKYLRVPKVFENCAHTRLAALPKVAKSGGKQDRPAAVAGDAGGIDRLYLRAWRSVYRSMGRAGCDLVLGTGSIGCRNNPGNHPQS